MRRPLARLIPVLFLALTLGMACARGAGCATRARNPGKKGGAVALQPGTPRTAELSGRVILIRDGDSFVVQVGGAGVEVRLDGVDCPELAQAFGRKARRFTSDLAFGRQVRLAVKGRDKYDREIVEAFLPDGRSLNRELVSAGYAWWFRRYSTDRDLEELERQARETRRGLWADPDPVPPWDFRNPR